MVKGFGTWENRFFISRFLFPFVVSLAVPLDQPACSLKGRYSYDLLRSSRRLEMKDWHHNHNGRAHHGQGFLLASLQ
ncbi:hypothetical protein BJY01DRAFT_193796 [Aspergillus pseudoustus]|uniref:Secreted protein n=1 Tax=Aspergillus pseudoustus TaxID=1810923 RepID=A0ABR4JUL9_9EURO